MRAASYRTLNYCPELAAWHARYSLAGLAVEEVGKADGLATLAAMPVGAPTLPARLVTMPLREVAEILDNAQAFAQDVDRLKQRGLYVDVDRNGQVREPSEVTAAEVREQLDNARRAASAACVLLDPGAPVWLANPEAAAVEFSRALVSAYAEAGHHRSPEAAADVLLNAASKLHR